MNAFKLVIGNKNYSTWSLRPWFFMKNLGIEFEEELVYLFEDDTSEKLSSYFSNEKVPLLLDSSNPESTVEIWDTLAIIEYLAEKYPQGWPQSQQARAFARSVSAEMHSSFDAVRTAMPMNCRKHFPNYPISADVQTDINRITQIWEYASKQFGSEGSWLFGEFSGADAMFAPIVLRFKGYDVKLTGFAADYSEMVLENKYIKEWVEAGKQETQIIELDEV